MTTSTPSSTVDEIFINLPPEWWHGQAMSSAHNADSIQPYDLGFSYLLVAYPRDGTPVCTGELIELQKRLAEFPCEVVAASTDSPESHNRFFNDDTAFPPEVVPNIEYPILSVNETNLTEKGKDLLLNDYGYCKRVAILVKEGNVRAVYETDNEIPRDMSTLIHLTKNILEKTK